MRGLVAGSSGRIVDGANAEFACVVVVRPRWSDTMQTGRVEVSMRDLRPRFVHSRERLIRPMITRSATGPPPTRPRRGVLFP